MTIAIDTTRSRGCRASALALSLVAGLTAASPIVRAGDPTDLAGTVRRAVQANDLGRTKPLGNTRNKAFEQLTGDGGVLVGFEFALSSFAGKPTVCALKPVFRSPAGEKVGSAVGPFFERKSARRGVNTEVPRRTVRVVARPGYAVAGLTVKSGMWIDGLSVQFARLVGGRLDPSDTYESNWVANEAGGGKGVVSTGGRVPVGVLGHEHPKDGCVAVGLVHLAEPDHDSATPAGPTNSTGPAVPPDPVKLAPVPTPEVRKEAAPPVAQPRFPPAAAPQPAAQAADADGGESKTTLLLAIGLGVTALVIAATVAGRVLAGSRTQEQTIGDLRDGTADPLAVLPEHLADRVTAELTAGEQVVWAAQPSPAITRMNAHRAGAITGFGALLAGVAVLLLTGLGGKAGLPMAGIFAVFVLLFLVAAVLAPSAVYRQAARTCYVITNRRAIVSIARLFGEGEIDSYSPAQLQGMQRRDSWWVRGAGDLVFRTKTVVTVTSYRNGPTTTNESVTRYGFLGVENVREVEKLVREALVNPLTDNMIGR